MIEKIVRFFIIFLSVAVVTMGMATAQSYEPPIHDLPQAVQDHVDLAYLLWNKDVSRNHLPDILGGVVPGPSYNTQVMSGNPKPLPPTRLFDQFYIVGGDEFVQVVALDTSEGIILWDALWTPEDGPDVIEPGMRKLGLDPARIKYLVLTHFHIDHTGCSKYLQDKYNARVLMSEADWELLLNPPPSDRAPDPNHPTPPSPARDMVITDGMKLTLGESTVTFYITPGHTPGSVSTIIPVTDNGEPHVLAMWGGTGPPSTIGPNPRASGLRAYEQSLIRFSKIGIDAHVDGVIANHASTDGSNYKVHMMANRKQGDPNPWIVGESTYLRFMGAFVEGIRAKIAMQEIKDKEAMEKGADVFLREVMGD